LLPHPTSLEERERRLKQIYKYKEEEKRKQSLTALSQQTPNPNQTSPSPNPHLAGGREHRNCYPNKLVKKVTPLFAARQTAFSIPIRIMRMIGSIITFPF